MENNNTEYYARQYHRIISQLKEDYEMNRRRVQRCKDILESRNNDTIAMTNLNEAVANSRYISWLLHDFGYEVENF